MESLKILQIPNDCTGCGACVNICPKKCLTLSPDKEGFYFPQYNSTNCIDCGLCEKTCHVLASDSNHHIAKDNFYIYRSDNIALLEQSSSGGAFSLFADYVLNKGGVVYGSRYNGDVERLEITSTDECSLNDLRKSKYIESFTNDSFKRIKNDLSNGRTVLFCGTPCQVRGIRQYLNTTKTSQDNFLAIDFVCHGVPSNMCFTEFKRTQETPKNKIINADFRYKNFSKHIFWHNMTLGLKYKDGKIRIMSPFHYYYYYYKPFLNDLTLRKSCYTCNCVLSSAADATIGDFWGVGRYKPEMDDNKGISFIKVNDTEKIRPVISECSNNSLFEPMPFEPNDRQFKHRNSSNKIPARDSFFALVSKMGYVHAVEKYYQLTPVKKMFFGIVGYVIFGVKKFVNAVRY